MDFTQPMISYTVIRDTIEESIMESARRKLILHDSVMKGTLSWEECVRLFVTARKAFKQSKKENPFLP